MLLDSPCRCPDVRAFVTTLPYTEAEAEAEVIVNLGEVLPESPKTAGILMSDLSGFSIKTLQNKYVRTMT